MTMVIASDIHGSALWTRRLLEACEAEQASQLLLLGDLLYHGPRNPLPEEYDPKEVARLLNSVAEHIIAVRGNCDSEVDAMLLHFPLAESAYVFVDGRRFICTHGHHAGPENTPPMTGGDVLLYGHTHVFGMEERDGLYFLNPGSVSLPKLERPNSFLVYRNGLFQIKDFSGTVLLENNLSEMV